MPDPRANDRARRRGAEDCPAPLPVVNGPLVPPVRPTLPCDVPVIPIPDVFLEPAAQPIRGTPTPNPNPFVIGNAAVTVQCVDVPGAGPLGDPIVLGESSITRNLNWLDFPDIPIGHLDHVTTIDPVVVLQAALTVSAEDFATLTHLTLDQVTPVQAAILRIQAEVNTQALIVARAALDCRWDSVTVAANCAPGALVTGQLNAVNPTQTAAGEFSSKISQENADAEALAQAMGALVCLFPNELISVNCTELGFAEPIPNDAELWPALGRARTGAVTVLAGTYHSSVSVEDANAEARGAAMASLVCFYINDPVTMSCVDVGKSATVPTPSDVVRGIPGSTVTVPQGYFSSDTSTSDATDMARLLASSMLNCFWTNAAITVNCPDQTVPDLDHAGETRLVHPSSKSPVIQVTVAAELYFSSTSQAEADDQARQAALSQLQCLYCNAEVLPRCVPDAILAQVLAHTLTLPLPISLITSDWSPDATLGLAADTYCDSDATTAQLVAGSGIEPPISVIGPVNDCRYGNDKVTTQCPTGMVSLGSVDTSGQTTVPVNVFMVTEEDVPVDFLPLETGRPKKYANSLAEALARTTLYCVFVNAGRNFTCSADAGKPDVDPNSSGTDSTPVVVAAQVFTSTESQADADAQEMAFGLTQLNCFYLSREARIYCGDSPWSETSGGGARLEDGTLPPIAYGNGTKTPADASSSRMAVSPQSNGASGTPILIPAGALNSVVSQVEADTLAFAQGVSSLHCFWTNVAVVVRCGAPLEIPWLNANNTGTPVTAGTGEDGVGNPVVTSPGSSTTPVTLNADTQISTVSVKHATATVYQMALATLNCLFGNQAQTASCSGSEVSVGMDEVSADMVLAETQEDADTTALAMLTANHQCLSLDALTGDKGDKGDKGDSGKDGKQTNCSGECFAIYK